MTHSYCLIRQVWSSLAKNKDLVISGESDAELNTLLLSDAILGEAKANQETKSQNNQKQCAALVQKE